MQLSATNFMSMTGMLVKCPLELDERKMDSVVMSKSYIRAQLILTGIRHFKIQPTEPSTVSLLSLHV